MNRRVRSLLLVAVLLVAALTLTGCGIPRGEVDLNNPPGWWEGIIVYPLAKLLMFLNRAIKGVGIPYSYGWAIVVLTLALKIVTLPLTLKQLQSTKAQQALQPQLKTLQEKYGKDRQKLSEEQMKLYKEAGFNPLGGCLPLLVQLPILWGLYQSLYVLANPSVGELAGQGFFWIPDLSFPDLTTGTKWIGEAFSGQKWGMLFAYFSLPVIMILTQLVMQKMSQPPKGSDSGKDSQTQMMSQMMMFMPLMFGYITLGLPSGLTLYWSVSNLLSVIQQYFVAGWGGLVDWLPMLEPRTAEIVGVAEAPPPTTEALKPAKRRRRRKKK